MFNKQIKNFRKCEIELLYAKTILTNISFAKISLNYIFNYLKFKNNIYENKHIYYFFHIQSLLNACGAIINVLRPFGRNSHSIRGKKLRELFNISLSRYKYLFQKEARNTNEHFDEQYKEFSNCIGDYNLLDENTPSIDREEILSTPHLRTYDIESKTYHTYIRKECRLQRYSLDLIELEAELNNLEATILQSEYYIKKSNLYFN